jgi:hypothetical protein
MTKIKSKSVPSSLKSEKLFDEDFLKKIRIASNKGRNSSLINSINFAILFCPAFKLAMKGRSIPQRFKMAKKKRKGGVGIPRRLKY